MDQENPYYQGPKPPPVPGSSAQPPPMYPTIGYGMAPSTTADDRTMAMLCHLLAILTGFVGPLILWLVKKDTSPFVDHHGREAINFQITVFLVMLGLSAITFILMFILIGIVFVPVIMVVGVLALVAEIIACAAANRGEWHRYPCCIRLV